ncbi:zinc finger protein castor homolog 1-like isoform X2 [Paramacrobiotus metropolitanus]|nr:zinc finger protein castor homolog 1-like isoform X2 [Paramacrobiotus metropolitanus]XP_055340063.1 zinc finger protein castor homolog 1-like isoform X2 [Paramacrobiotus metropolitanus]
MSKLGAICDKLRQNGHNHNTSVLLEDVHDDIADNIIKGSKRNSPDIEPIQKVNKRKNFRPVSTTGRNEKTGEAVPNRTEENTAIVESEEHSIVSPAGSVDVDVDVDIKSECGSHDNGSPVSSQTSVIVANPAGSTANHSPIPSPSIEPSQLQNIALAQRMMYNGLLEREMEEKRRLLSTLYGGHHGMYHPPQFMPFVDYRNMGLMYNPLTAQNTSNVDDSLNLEDDEDDGSLADSEDGRLANASQPQPNGERLSGNSSANERRETGLLDSDGWKWSGVRNSIRSLDIWQYVKHYRNDEICQSAECRTLGLKEHFHCLTCPNKVIFRKEEMIRHVKWHKKRDETLQLGFLRFSGNDDCSQQFSVCPHAGRQTHYHCLMNGCQKVYTSTSDVQMHANLHRKEMAINKEGFRRYRSMDDCGESSCPFRDQKSTHFHCIRSSCTFTFKNKADIEKHKAYHAKNDELAKDGFRKYMKYEHCMFDSCPYSKIMNHIHCIRQGCRYVFTSSAQLHAHKRKHDKNDLTIIPNTTAATPKYTHDKTCNLSSDSEEDSSEFHLAGGNHIFSSDDDDDDDEISGSYIDLSKKSHGKLSNEKPPFNTALLRAAEAANMQNVASSKQRQPLHTENNVEFTAPQARKNLAVSHMVSDMSSRGGTSVSPISRTPFGVTEFVTNGTPAGSQFSRSLFGLPHPQPANPLQALNSLSALSSLVSPSPMPYPPFKRKRGRPPKNPVIDVHVYPSVPSANHNLQAMFSSFKLGKGGILMDVRQESATVHRNLNAPSPSLKSEADKLRERAIHPKPISSHEHLPHKSPNCPYQSCVYRGKEHYHCAHPRCHFASERDDILALHSREFHANIDILEGYEFFDQSVDCGLSDCPSNGLTRHFHCVRPNCLYSFVRYDTMATHEEKHRSMQAAPSPPSPPAFSMTHPVFAQLNLQRESRSDMHTIKTEDFGEGRFFCHPMLSKMHFTADKPCPHRVCRLAQREHFHCENCEQPYTSSLRLQTHLRKCQNGHAASPPPLPSSVSLPILSKFPVNSPSPHRSSPSEMSDGSETNMNGNGYGSKKIKFIPVAFSSNGRGLNGGADIQPAPDGEHAASELFFGDNKLERDGFDFLGFHRFLCTETCDWEECPLSRKQTHWHCQEEHCRQFFSDKTRLLRHSERHRRLAAIVGDDFRRYSSKVSCDDDNCSLKHSSHVHCLQCDFTCTETAKISTHRRSHSKQNAVSAAGFDKFSFRNPCRVPSCLYYTQTHYHCKTCSVVVNTMSQMQVHQIKHDQGYVEDVTDYSMKPMMLSMD